MHDNYDVQGRVRRIEQRVQNFKYLKTNEKLRNLCDSDSFDAEFSSSGQVIQQTNYAYSGAVYGSEQFFYGERGALIRTLKFDSAGSPLGREDFQYDNQGRCVGWTAHDASGGLTRRCVHRYAGELLMSSATCDANGLSVREEDFEYAGSTRVKSVCRYYGAYRNWGPAGTLCESWVTGYDAQGRRVETFGLCPNGLPLGDGRYTLEYDDAGRELKMWTFSDCFDRKDPDAVTVFEYKTDEVGNWVERCAFHRFRCDASWGRRVTIRTI